MRLKKIRLAGFKSFVDPTNIPFPDDMTAIVGPNGCGKSNVIDAVRWVLGESSAKNLRGDAMTDVIFNGSSARKPVSQCSVELVFDNTSGRIQGEFANYNELSVKRVVTREAQSNYYLNGTKCRRRDVTDIFLGTGLGPRSYAIIEQGMISRLIESKPQELRVFIEEAAGISKYKERRRETENRIRHTKENLERLEDVRGELGQQIEKLQRQANAAKKYTDFKSKERRLKAELAAIKWIKHSENLSRLQTQIQQQERDIDEFVAKQRGDEKDITGFKQQQLDLKQSVSDFQQQSFKIGTEITKLEQNQLHAKQRTANIQKELAELIISLEQTEQLARQETKKREALSLELANIEPQQETLAAQLEAAQETLLEHQEQQGKHEKTWRDQDQAFQQTKQQAQNCHSQIQGTMNMQMRTQQRISELQQEQNELEHDVLAQQIESLYHQVAQAKGRLQHGKHRVEETQRQVQELQQKQDDLSQLKFEIKGDIQKVDAQLSGLKSMQMSEQAPEQLQQWLTQKQIPNKQFWQQLQVESGWEKAVEVVTQNWQRAMWIDSLENVDLSEWQSGGKLVEESNMTTEKPAGSLATKLTNSHVPYWLTQIMISDDLISAKRMQPELLAAQSVVTRCGVHLGKGWIDLGSAEEGKGLIQREGQIKSLSKALTALHDKHNEQVDTPLNELLPLLTDAKARLDDCKQDVKQAEQALTQQQNQLNLLEMQHQQTLTRQTKLSEELAKQNQLFEDERLQSEQLAEQAQELELALEALQDQQQAIAQQKNRLLETEQHARHQVDMFTNESHQLALKVQGVKSQFHGVNEAQKRTIQLVDTLVNRQQQLENEHAELALPLASQQQNLHGLLSEKAELEIKLSTKNALLSDVEEKLSLAEKGQQGVVEKVQQMRVELQSLSLESEGYKVRANSTLEQLNELNQPLKEVLDTLPEDAEESQWQQQLESTSASISRLGAVNLAAVEEYEIQSKRKQHLDEQNDDLVAAMETLESAIRKIDKETRARFKQTYDKVNSDLKELFPKVFGGGAAYLELTGEDLLETGVTIMARPPGKKNSTIHLLSGGEKALTALSLVFAIFKLNPAPFCLLDEVDAPLDDANVGRFCKLVSEMSKTVQFIYITHNKIAMEMAKHLTGVTMAEPGVSRMVSVDVEEAVAIAHA